MGFAALLPATLLLAPAPLADARHDLACSAAQALIEAWSPRMASLSVVFSTEPASPPEPGQKLEWKGGPGPEPDLLTALIAAGETNALPQCASFGTYLHQRRISFGRGAVERSEQASRRRAGRPPYVGRLSMPVLSADGTQALMVSGGGEGIYQGASLIHLTLGPDGKWREAATADLWYF